MTDKVDKPPLFEEWAESNNMYERGYNDYIFEDSVKAWNAALDVAAARVPIGYKQRILAHKVAKEISVGDNNQDSLINSCHCSN